MTNASDPGCIVESVGRCPGVWSRIEGLVALAGSTMKIGLSWSKRGGRPRRDFWGHFGMSGGPSYVQGIVVTTVYGKENEALRATFATVSIAVSIKTLFYESLAID